MTQPVPVEPGQHRRGTNHHSVWVVFAAAGDLYDLWCADPGTSTHHRSGAITTGHTAERIADFLPKLA